MRGVKSTTATHWVTINALPSGYTLEKTYKIISLSATVSGTSMLYECTADKSVTNFISTDSACEGFTLIQKLGYIYKAYQTNTAALYRCYIYLKDHFVSSNSTCEQSFVTNEGSLGYYILS